MAAAQIGFGVVVLPPWTRRAPIEFGALVALYGLAAGDRGQSRAAYAQQWLHTGLGSYWVGGAISGIDRVASFTSNAVEAGATFVDGGTSISVSVSSTSTNDREVFRFTSMRASEFAERLRVADAALAVSRVGTRLQVDVRGGVRFAVEGLNGVQGFGVASLGWRVRGALSVLASGGYQVADPLRGTPQWRFVALGVRVGGSSRAVNASPSERAGPALHVERIDSATVRILVSAPADTRSIELAGTLTDWNPVPMTLGPDGWSATVRTTGGSHRVMIRVNGDWRVPGNLTPVEDEFGMRAGILIVPR